MSIVIVLHRLNTQGLYVAIDKVKLFLCACIKDVVIEVENL